MLGAYAGIFTLLSMLIDSKAISATVCMVSYVVLFLGAPFLQTAVFSYYHGASLNHMPNESIRPFLEFYMISFRLGRSFRFRVSLSICIGSRCILSSALH